MLSEHSDDGSLERFQNIPVASPELDGDDIQSDIDTFEDMLEGCLVGKCFSKEDIKDLGYYQSLRKDDQAKNDLLVWYARRHLDCQMVEKDKDVVNYCIAELRKFENRTSGSVERVCMNLLNKGSLDRVSHSDVKTIKSILALTALVNGSGSGKISEHTPDIL